MGRGEWGGVGLLWELQDYSISAPVPCDVFLKNFTGFLLFTSLTTIFLQFLGCICGFEVSFTKRKESRKV